jgi:UDP-GlcNAc:undecaprenyl-phosphate GlcNAc-1-phosphate transferase
MGIALAALFSVLVAAALTPRVGWFAQRRGLVAPPRDDRWHQKPTALLGGVAIYISVLLSFIIFTPRLTIAYPLLAAGTLMFATGLIDDVVHIKPYTKLVLQLIAASVVVSFGLRLPWGDYRWVNDVLTIFWLVGITNAINLLDNMDGLAAGITSIASFFLTLTLLLNGQVNAAIVAAVIGSAALGFLLFNFNPASIFMGDSGSMFLGFMLSGTALLADTGRFRGLTSVLLTPVLILMTPIFDTCFVTVSRKMSGRPISQGGRDHTSHRLVALGISERRAVVMLYAFAAISGGLALLVRFLATAWVLALVPVFALGVLFVGLYLGKVRVYEAGEDAPGPRIINALADFSYKRRIFEVLLDVVLIVLAYYGAYILRWDGHLDEEQVSIFMKTIPLIIMVQLTAFLVGGVYRGLWRYLGISDLIVLVRSVIAGSAASALVVLLMYRFHGPSRAVFLLNMLLLLVFVGASRLSFRLLRALLAGRAPVDPNAKPVLIYGAGDGGELLIREILNNPGHRYAPVGFIDDDDRKAGKLIHGYRIFGLSQLPELIRRHAITEILISSLKVPDSRLDYLRSTGVCLRKMTIRIE